MSIRMTKCSICGADNTNDQLCYPNIAHDMCFRCDFWTQIVVNANPDCVVVNGSHYYIASTGVQKRKYSGCGGQIFHILKSDGTRITTDNLWHQGTVPLAFRAQLPDNAKFVEEA